MKSMHASHPVSVLLFALAAGAANAEPLTGLGADLNGLSVSGVSAGGYMATQFQVAHSAMVGGAGVIAAGPYDCAEGDARRALSNCMTPDDANPVPELARTLERVRQQVAAGRIDPIEGLRDDRVWVFSGDADHVVERTVVDSLVTFYRAHVAEDALTFVTLPDAGHAMISVAAQSANACPSTDPPFINRCGEFDAAGEMLAHLVGPLAPRTPAREASLRRFDQAPHTQPRAPVDLSMADTAFVYVPRACEAGGCRVHVAFHGCLQGADAIGLDFVTGAGYNEWAEANDLIVLYPQVRARDGFAWGSRRWVFNPAGCWDWWGYTDDDYPTREGSQIRAVHSMLQKLAEPVTGTPDN
ncbi:extracellular catalytic domain type 2 short-chain-length polyhydroxyalkanoate depolymerase [Rhodocyclaceae bacterium SMB388]